MAINCFLINWGPRCCWPRSGGLCLGLSCALSSGPWRFNPDPNSPALLPEWALLGQIWLVRKRATSIGSAARPGHRTCSLLRLHVPAKTQNSHEASLAPQHHRDLSCGCLNHEGFGSFLPGITKTHPAVPRWDAGQETRHREPAASPASQATGQGADPGHPSPPSLYVNP